MRKTQFGTIIFVTLAALWLVACNRTPAENQPGEEGNKDRTGVAEGTPTPAPTAPTETAPAPAPPAAAVPATACNLEGQWSESWKGVAAGDGRQMSGKSVVKIVKEGELLKATGNDANNPMTNWSGGITVAGSEVTYQFVASDKTYNGTYVCKPVDPACSSLECQVNILNESGTPNLKGTATWTRPAQ